MNKVLLAIFVVHALSACVMGPRPFTTQNEVAQGTSATDAIEGDTEESGGLLDLLRTREDAVPGDPNWTPIYPSQSPEPFSGQRVLFFSDFHAQDLYNGTKPRSIGDIVTVLLEEKTQAKKSANNDTTKSNDLSLDPIDLGGQQIKIGEATLAYTVKNDNKTKGSSNADQSNSITGSISVEVVDVLTNGNLLIGGKSGSL